MSEPKQNLDPSLFWNLEARTTAAESPLLMVVKADCYGCLLSRKSEISEENGGQVIARARPQRNEGRMHPPSFLSWTSHKHPHRTEVLRSFLGDRCVVLSIMGRISVMGRTLDLTSRLVHSHCFLLLSLRSHLKLTDLKALFLHSLTLI